jgi:hypothetical protein
LSGLSDHALPFYAVNRLVVGRRSVGPRERKAQTLNVVVFTMTIIRRDHRDTLVIRKWLHSEIASAELDRLLMLSFGIGMS